MKKSIKNLATKEIKNINAVKGGDGGGITTGGSYEGTGNKPKRLGGLSN